MRQIILVIFLDAIGDKSNSRPVLLAMPPGPEESQPALESLIHLSISKRFCFAVIPSPAPKSSHVRGETLLHIHPNSILARRPPEMCSNIGNGINSLDE